MERSKLWDSDEKGTHPKIFTRSRLKQMGIEFLKNDKGVFTFRFELPKLGSDRRILEETPVFIETKDYNEQFNPYSEYYNSSKLIKKKICEYCKSQDHVVIIEYYKDMIIRKSEMCVYTNK